MSGQAELKLGDKVCWKVHGDEGDRKGRIIRIDSYNERIYVKPDGGDLPVIFRLDDHGILTKIEEHGEGSAADDRGNPWR